MARGPRRRRPAVARRAAVAGVEGAGVSHRGLPEPGGGGAAAAAGQGVAPAIAHLVAPELRHRRLRAVDLPGLPIEVHWHISGLAIDRRTRAASSFHRFSLTPQAMHLMHDPRSGVPPSRFRPPVYVTIWS